MTKYIGPKTAGENVATQADKLSLSSETPHALTPDQSGAAGTATTAARADHQHEITAGIAGTILPDATAAEGSSTSFARSDHTHAIAAASAGTITGTNAEGTSTSFARADHNHEISLPRAQAKRTSNQAIATGTLVSVTLPEEDKDTDGFHNTSSNTSRMTIPSGLGGDYLATSWVQWAGNNTGGRELRWRLNGNSMGEGMVQQPSVDGNVFRQATSYLFVGLVAGDYIEIGVIHGRGSDLNIELARLSIVRVG